MIIEKLRKKLSPKGNIYPPGNWKWTGLTVRVGNMVVGYEERVGGEEEGRGAGERRTCRNGIVEMEEGQR